MNQVNSTQYDRRAADDCTMIDGQDSSWGIIITQMHCEWTGEMC
jgi:hypothetical protein